MDEFIAGYYRLNAPALPIAVGGLTGYAVTDQRDAARAFLAVQVRPSLPPRARLLAGRAAAAAPHAVMPLDQGPGRDAAGRAGYFIICPALPGAAISADPKPWSEHEAMHCLLLPAAMALDQFAERGISHRAIRPDNIFRGGPGEKIVLGPHWATPPGSLQPGAFEPPYSAQCLPTGRGDGTPHDDVYALGVTLLWCVLGGQGEWADEEALLRRKLSAGSLSALLGRARLSPSMIDLLRGMLAEDPEHRPPPALLLDPEQARSRRVATRPASRAQAPLELAGVQAWFPRELAWALGANPEPGAALIRNGAVGTWLRRSVGDSQMALRLDEALARLSVEAPVESPKPAHVVVARAVAALDPLAPLVWRGHALFPDGVATVLVSATLAGQTAVVQAMEELLTLDATTAYLAGRVPRPDYIYMQQEARDWRAWLMTRGVTGGLPRVLYGANPLMGCASPLLGGRVVARLADLLPTLEEIAGEADRKRPPMDAHLAAFIAARADPSVLGAAARLTGFASSEDRLCVLGLFARLQQRTAPEKLPKLAGWLLESGLAELGVWRCLATRKHLGEKLAEAAAKGIIAPMALLLQDSAGRAIDAAGAQAAANRLAEIEAILNGLRSGAERRGRQARQTGQEIATGISILSLLGGAITVALAG